MTAVLLLALAADVRIFEYDRTQAADYREEFLAERRGIGIYKGSFASPGTAGRVSTLMVRPPGNQIRAGIVFQHGGGQGLYTYLPEAIQYARRGAVCLIVDAPGGDPVEFWKSGGDGVRDHYARVTKEVHRAVTILAARKDVNERRIAYVGHSYGANSGAHLAAMEKRIQALVLIGGVPKLTGHVRSPLAFWAQWRKDLGTQAEAEIAKLAPLDADQFLKSATTVPVLVQCGRFDPAVSEKECRALYDAAAGPKQIQWFDTDHDFHDPDAFTARRRWLTEKLGLRAVSERP